jgi:tryptophanyl-tRNA synthetase
MSTSLAQRRSAELEEQIDADAGVFRILTGDRPTGLLHLGHYFGTLRTGSGCRISARRSSC